MEGWIKLHRKIFDNPYYFSEPFTRSQAWIDLLLLANHQDGFFYKRGIKVQVKRGQVGFITTSLSVRWKWSRGKVNRFLNELEIDNQIEQQKSNVTTLLSIVNYDIYQGDDTANDTANDTSNGTANDLPNDLPNGQQTDTNKNVKNVKKRESINILSHWRNDFSIYQKECKEAFRKIYEDSDFITKQELFNPGVNIKKTLYKAYENFWGTEAGWEYKKKNRNATINWKNTITNAISLNKVYYTKQELSERDA